MARFFVGLKPYANPEKQKQKQDKSKGEAGVRASDVEVK
jgi:hypothetical protein